MSVNSRTGVPKACIVLHPRDIVDCNYRPLPIVLLHLHHCSIPGPPTCCRLIGYAYLEYRSISPESCRVIRCKDNSGVSWLQYNDLRGLQDLLALQELGEFLTFGLPRFMETWCLRLYTVTDRYKTKYALEDINAAVHFLSIPIHRKLRIHKYLLWHMSSSHVIDMYTLRLKINIHQYSQIIVATNHSFNQDHNRGPFALRHCEAEYLRVSGFFPH